MASNGRDTMVPQRVEFKVSTEDTQRSVVSLFSNFVAIARAGTEVQFDFVALDLNELALAIEANKASGQTEMPLIKGKTVARVVVPLHVFMQLEHHLQSIFSAVKKEFSFGETSNEQRRAIS